VTDVVPENLRPARFDRWSLGLSIIAVAPLVVAAVRMITAFSGYTASSDNAANELAIRDVGSRLVLLGPFSRHGWSHPGPAFAYLMAVPYRVFGSDSAAMLVGALLVNALAIATIVLVARRWGGLELASVVALGMALLTVTLPSTFLADPWNPFVTVFPFGAYLMLVWASTCGDRWALPVACGVGTFCVQTHIGYAGPVAVLLAWAIYRALRDRRASRPNRDTRRGLTMLGVSAVVLVVLWLPPVYEQFAHSPGNITATYDYFSRAAQPPQGIRNGARVVAAQFTLAPDWLLGLRGVSPFSGEPAAMHQNAVPLLLLAFAAAGVVAFRRRYLALRGAVIVLALTIGVGALAAAQIIGAMAEYRLRWLWVVAALTVALTVAIGIRRLAERTPSIRRVAVVVATAGAVALAGVGVARATSAEPPDAQRDAEVARVAHQLIAHVGSGHDPVLLRAASQTAFEDMKGVALAMDQAGIGVRVPESTDNRLTFGRSRADRHGRVRGLYVVVTDAQIDDYRRHGNREVAYVGAVGPAEHTRLDRRYRQLQRRGATALGREFASIAGRLHAIAVFSVPRFPHDRVN
jgi:hypothetical protein